MSSLAEIERAAGTLPKHEMERLFGYLADRLGRSEMPGESNHTAGRHGVLDIRPVHLGRMLPLSGEDGLLGEMLEGRL